MSILTGLTAYLFLEKKGADQNKLDQLEDKDKQDESTYIRLICVLLLCLYIIILLANFHKVMKTSPSIF